MNLALKELKLLKFSFLLTMASKRSYRDILSQEAIKNEIEKGKGTQFDPYFAELMLELIDEDTHYQMRER